MTHELLIVLVPVAVALINSAGKIALAWIERSRKKKQ